MNHAFGIVAAVAGLLLAAVAAWLHRCGHHRLAVLLLMAGGVIVRAFMAADPFLHDWDERYHALVARHLIAHPLTPMLYERTPLPYDFRNWTSNHIWLHKQPLTLWMMAGSMALFGVKTWALRLPSLLLSTACIPLTYATGRFFAGNRSAAFFAALLLCFNGLVLDLGAGRVATDHVDVAFLAFILAGIWSATRHISSRRAGYTVLAGAFMGMAILCKWLPALIIWPVWLALSFGESRKSRDLIWGSALMLGTAIVVALPWQLYIHSRFPGEAAWEAAFNVRHFTASLEGQGGGPLYFLEQIRINYGEWIYLPVAWAVLRIIRPSQRNARLVALCLWWAVPLLIFSLARTKMQGYLLFTAPAYGILTAVWYDWLKARKFRSGFRYAVPVAGVLIVALAARYSLERMKPLDRQEAAQASLAEIRKIGDAGLPARCWSTIRGRWKRCSAQI